MNKSDEKRLNQVIENCIKSVKRPNPFYEAIKREGVKGKTVYLKNPRKGKKS